MTFETNKNLNKAVKGACQSAFDASRAAESANDFGAEAAAKFGENERGSEDVLDMMEKGTI